MSVRVKRLDQGIVCPFMRYIESGSYGTSIWVFPAGMEDILIESLVQVIDTVIESENHQLWSSAEKG